MIRFVIIAIGLILATTSCLQPADPSGPALPIESDRPGRPSPSLEIPPPR